MGEIGREPCRKPAKERVEHSILREGDRLCSQPFTDGVVTYFASKGGNQLVAETRAESRESELNHDPNPVRGAFAPWLANGSH